MLRSYWIAIFLRHTVFGLSGFLRLDRCDPSTELSSSLGSWAIKGFGFRIYPLKKLKPSACAPGSIVIYAKVLLLT